MTTFKQIEANRRNARHSTGPISEEGKLRSRQNAVRHGLTAETVIGALEDAEDYRAFEAAVIGDYEAQSAVERELVLRLASLLWRIRRATTMETGLFEIQATHLLEFRKSREARQNPVHRWLSEPNDTGVESDSEHISQAAISGTNADHCSLDTSRDAFCVSPTYRLTRWTDSAVTKPLFGAKQARPCLHLTLCIAASDGKDRVDCDQTATENGQLTCRTVIEETPGAWERRPISPRRHSEREIGTAKSAPICLSFSVASSQMMVAVQSPDALVSLCLEARGVVLA
jgi:hypothetical protein